MEALLWNFRVLDSMVLAGPILFCLVVCLGFLNWDFPILVGRLLARLALRRPADHQLPPGTPRPSALVIIPSLLRNRDDLRAIEHTVETCAKNGYPGDLVIVPAIDGCGEAPALLGELRGWLAALALPERTTVRMATLPERQGKMMAVHAAATMMKEAVARGEYPEFPAVYFSIDGDGTLNPGALEHMVARLTRRHPITGRMRRVVAGKICIRHDRVWRGWRKLLTVEGLIYLQVAGEFQITGVGRHNIKPMPQVGIPGALYCTWSELLLAAPHYVGFMRSLRQRDRLLWWLGVPPPRFSERGGAACPEALTGAADDTCMAYLASMATWKNGRLSLDAPPTPLHALGRTLLALFIERSHDYAPEARVYTYTPTTIKGLWLQRLRWNSSHIECAHRFRRAFWFHWEIAYPVMLNVLMVLRVVFEAAVYYVVLPYACFGSAWSGVSFLLGLAGQILTYEIHLGIALLLERERAQCWPVLLSGPLAPLHSVFINCFAAVAGVIRDLLLLGNANRFAPEATLIKGGNVRPALLFRLRRMVLLCLRSVIQGDVPLGTFWLGWHQTRWTPSGFAGWTGGRPRPILHLGRPSLGWLRDLGVPGASSPPPALAPVRVPSERGAHR